MSAELEDLAGLSGLDDTKIAQQICSGQSELFRLLVERHQQHVYALGMSFFHNMIDCEDFTQEVFLKAYRNLGQFKGKSRFSTWLYRIAYNTAINSVKRRKEYVSLAENDEQESAMRTPDEENIREAALLAVRQAVAELPEKYRVCIDLFFFYDRSYDEIEAITGDPVNTVKSHVFRAKKILRQKLKDI
ncbi:MAG: sigma-70 family RNA polymerase sigma factor [Spirochaetaceae bacterium]|jgi:RNA polymerase sigma-70 factor (ECF subfamily)|nr:sigma-70 family RNA polymerase sigma factor [Spirochaetaceae bacterium]